MRVFSFAPLTFICSLFGQLSLSFCIVQLSSYRITKLDGLLKVICHYARKSISQISKHKTWLEQIKFFLGGGLFKKEDSLVSFYKPMPH